MNMVRIGVLLCAAVLSPLEAQQRIERFAPPVRPPLPAGVPAPAAAESGTDWSHLGLSALGGAAGAWAGSTAGYVVGGGEAGLVGALLGAPLGATAAAYWAGDDGDGSLGATFGGAVLGTAVAAPVAILVLPPLALLLPGVGAYLGYRRSAAPLALAAAGALGADTLVGREVRVVRPVGGADSVRTGTVEAVPEPGVLRVRFPSGIEAVSLPPLEANRVELNVGAPDRSRRMWIGAGLGAGAGFLGGMLLLLAPSEGANMAPVGALFVGAPLGGLVGGIIGAGSARDSWRALEAGDVTGR